MIHSRTIWLPLRSPSLCPPSLLSLGAPTSSTRRFAETKHAEYHDRTDNACALVERRSSGRNTENSENGGEVRRNDVPVNEQEQSKCASSNGKDEKQRRKGKDKRKRRKEIAFPLDATFTPGPTMKHVPLILKQRSNDPPRFLFQSVDLSGESFGIIIVVET